MGTPYVGEIRMFGGNFNPSGWNFCDGSLLPIAEYDTLFNLIGTTYGGDGETTFALPDLRGRVPMHMGTGAGTTVTLAQTGGAENVTLTTQQIPLHTHNLLATTTGLNVSPSNTIMAVPSSSVSGLLTYGAGPPTTALIASSIQNDGGNQPHSNLQPYLCFSFIISLFGVYPSPT
ncbi:MAG TPA: tail fiber protein [Rhizomicrobium sp.]|nr:tail fiber protein [Rhizomicrobium sp.]